MKRDSWILERVEPLRKGLQRYFENVAIGMFDWKGFDNKAIPKRYPERWLYTNGNCVYFKYKDQIPMLLPVALTNITKNVYGEPAEWRAVAIGDMSSKVNNIQFNDKNSVLIRNDVNYEGSKPFVDYQIEQLINIDLTTRLNVNAKKMPFMFKGDFNEALKNKNTFQELMECRPVFFKTQFANQEFEVLNNDVEFIGEQLSKLYQVYWNRILTYLGVNAVTNEKAERMLVDEIHSNSEEKTYIRTARLEQRKIACDNIKDIFGEDITVEYKEVELDERLLQRTQGFGNSNGVNEGTDGEDGEKT